MEKLAYELFVMCTSQALHAMKIKWSC